MDPVWPSIVKFMAVLMVLGFYVLFGMGLAIKWAF